MPHVFLVRHRLPEWYDFANPNDLYTDSPVGTNAGTDEELIYNCIMVENFGNTKGSRTIPGTDC